MAIHAGVAISKNTDSYQAGSDAARGALDQLKGQKPDFFIAFASVALDQDEMLRGIRDAGGGAPVVGCSDAGEITNEGPAQKSVGVMAVKSDTIMVTIGRVDEAQKDGRERGRTLAREIQAASTAPPRIIMMFPDVLTANGMDVVRGVTDIMGEHFPVVGGAAGDDFLFEKTYQYAGDRVIAGSVTGAGLAGQFSAAVGVRHGWIPIGVPMRVTKSKGAVVFEIDHKPAIRIYEEYFGKEAQDMRKEPLARVAITYPLGIKISDMDEYLIRDPITVDEQGAITCAAEIPEGSEIRLMIGSREKAIDAARDAARHVMDDFKAQNAAPKFMLMFNCIAREKLFGMRAHEEIDAVMDIIGRDVPLLGFYTYGEIAPVRGEMRLSDQIRAGFYNETMVLLGVGE